MKIKKTLRVKISIILVLIILLFGGYKIYDNYTKFSSSEAEVVDDLPELKLPEIKYENQISVNKSYEELNKEMETLKAERLEAERKAREEAERKERERLAKLEAERKAKLEAERKAREEQRKKEVAVSRGGSSGGKTYFYEVTFYSSDYASTGKHPSDPYYGITASGTKAQVGRTVACPKSIPFGTKVHIEGFGHRICEDRGGAIKQGKLDIFVSSEKEAYRLGRQKLKVAILN